MIYLKGIILVVCAHKNRLNEVLSNSNEHSYHACRYNGFMKN